MATDSTFIETFREASAAAARPLEGRTVPRKAVVVAAAVIVLLYAAHVNGRWQPSYDDAHYLILGRSIAAGEGYRLNGQIDNVFPPGVPLLLAGVFATVGDNFYVFQAIMVLFGLGSLVLIHACLKRLTGPTTALLVTAATALSYRYYSAAGKILSDVPTTMLLYLAMYICLRGCRGTAYRRRTETVTPGRAPRADGSGELTPVSCPPTAWLALAAATAVAAVLFRAAGVLMMGALGVGLFLDKSLGGTWRRRLTAGVAVILPAVATTLVLYALARQTGDAAPRYETQIQDALDIHHHPILAYGMRLRAAARELPRLLGNVFTGQQFGAYGVAIMVLAAVGMGAGAVRRHGLAVAMCILYSLGLVFVVVTEIVIHARMWFAIQPLLLLLALQGVTFLCVLVAERVWPERGKAAGRNAAAALVAVVLVVAVGTSLPRVFKEAFVNTAYRASDKYYAKLKMREIGAFLPLAEKTAELDARDRSVYMGGFHEAKLMQYVTGRRWVLWPEVDPSEDAAVASAEQVHRRAVEDPAITTALLPLKYRMPQALAREVRKAFDGDPAWRLVVDNEYYALYHRSADAEGRPKAAAAAAKDPHHDR